MKIGRIAWGQWEERAWIAALWLAAIVLFLIGLGDVALRDWDEGIVAQVARDIWRSQSQPNSLTWLYPTIGGAPYLNKPTLVHWLIAQCYAIGGVNEWMARLPGALLSASSVPLLYGVGRELFSRRTPAIFAALIYLTLLPVVRHGRLAMLDGALVCFFLVMIYCLLRSRRDLRWAVGVGIGFGLTCLTKGAVGILLAAIACLFMLWDTPRLLRSRYLWLGLLLGSAPVAAWYWAQWLKYGSLFIGTNLINQSFSRLWSSVEGNRGPIWYYLLELLKTTLPWLVFLPQGFKLAWEHRNLGWAKLVLVWAGGYLLVISLMQTKLPWYVMPLYPALALVGGAMLDRLWDVQDVFGVRSFPPQRYPVAWWIIFGILAIVGWSGSIYFSVFQPRPFVPIILGAIALTFTIVTLLLRRQDSQFILVLIWGMYVALLITMLSPCWLWELQDSFAVKPVATLLQATPPGQIVVMSHPHSRPSLNFYSDRSVVSAVEFYALRQMSLTAAGAIERYWQETPQPYVLVDRATLQQTSLPSARRLGEAENFVLMTRNSGRSGQ